MKKRKKGVNKVLVGKVLIGLFLLALVGFIGVKLWIHLHPVYKIETRLSNVSKENKKREEPIVGWIRVQGTNIDYPIVSTATGADVTQVTKYDFAWSNSDSKKIENREVILGHNILNISNKPLITNNEHRRFEQLMSFIYYDFAKENQYIQYTYQGKEYLYKIFAISFIEKEELDYYQTKYSRPKLNKYIENAKNNSFFNYDVDVNSTDNILTLITCTRFYGMDKAIDFKIDARRVREKEDIVQYKLAESKKYDKIKGELKKEEKSDESEEI